MNETSQVESKTWLATRRNDVDRFRVRHPAWRVRCVLDLPAPMLD